MLFSSSCQDCRMCACLTSGKKMYLPKCQISLSPTTCTPLNPSLHANVRFLSRCCTLCPHCHLCYSRQDARKFLLSCLKVVGSQMYRPRTEQIRTIKWKGYELLKNFQWEKQAPTILLNLAANENRIKCSDGLCSPKETFEILLGCFFVCVFFNQ